MDIIVYRSLLNNIQTRIQNAQTRAALSANAEMIMLYWEIGKLIHQQQIEQGWGATVTSRLANDIKNELPELKDSQRETFNSWFNSVRNIILKM